MKRMNECVDCEGLVQVVRKRGRDGRTASPQRARIEKKKSGWKKGE